MATLQLFDFDKTLFRSPDPPKNVWEFSLGPPLVPKVPGTAWWVQETLQAAREAIADPQTYTVLMTGRTADLFTTRVHELLAQQGLQFDEIHLTTPGVATEQFKIEQLKKILGGVVVDRVVIWDDDFDRMSQYKGLVESLGVPCETHWVFEGRTASRSDSFFIYASLVNDGCISHAKGSESLDTKILYRRMIRKAMLAQHDRDVAAYALRNAQATQGSNNFVTALKQGIWDWDAFEERARGRLRLMPGKRSPQVETYILSRLKDFYDQGAWNLMYHYTPKVIL